MDTNADKLRNAFRWIDAERMKSPGTALETMIERACERFELTPVQADWVRWTLDPRSVAVQPKEPEPRRSTS
jgi:hypothetical protein